MNLISVTVDVWLFVQTLCIIEVYGEPQLDLPPVNINNKAKPEIYHNSYTVKIENEDDEEPSRKQSDATNYDRDRSMRYGPPYYNEDNDRYYTNRNRSYYSHDSQSINNDDDKYYANRNPSRDPEYDNGYNYNNNNYNNNNYNYGGGYQYGKVPLR